MSGHDPIETEDLLTRLDCALAAMDPDQRTRLVARLVTVAESLAAAPSRKPLTHRQREVYEAICDSILSRGYPPTVRELGAVCGVGSTNGINDHLKALERKGWIVREPGAARGIEVV